jgi:hypothetical protein
MEIGRTAKSIVLGLLLLVGESSLPQTGPRDVLEKFCELDAQGKQLTADGWREIAALFAESGSRRHSTKIIVIRDFVVSRPAAKRNTAEFYVEYIILGELDLAIGRFTQSPVVKVRSGFDLVLKSPVDWQIEGTPPEPHLTVDAAIRCVKETRDRTTDPSMKKNIEQSLARLSRLSTSQ